jgi:glutamyl-tRNA synthetase
MNGHYIREATDARLTALLMEAAEREGLAPDPEVLAAAVPLVKERMRTTNEGLELLRFLFVDPVEPDEKALRMLGPDRADYLGQVAERLRALEPWEHEGIHSVLTQMKDEHALSSKNAFQPVRAAVTGVLVSPPLFESMEVLGKDRSLERILAAERRAREAGADAPADGPRG